MHAQRGPHPTHRRGRVRTLTCLPQQGDCPQHLAYEADACSSRGPEHVEPRPIWEGRELGGGALTNRVHSWNSSGIQVCETSPSSVDESVDIGAQANPTGVYPILHHPCSALEQYVPMAFVGLAGGHQLPPPFFFVGHGGNQAPSESSKSRQTFARRSGLHDRPLAHGHEAEAHVHGDQRAATTTSLMRLGQLDGGARARSQATAAAGDSAAKEHATVTSDPIDANEKEKISALFLRRPSSSHPGHRGQKASMACEANHHEDMGSSLWKPATTGSVLGPPTAPKRHRVMLAEDTKFLPAHTSEELDAILAGVGSDEAKFSKAGNGSVSCDDADSLKRATLPAPDSEDADLWLSGMAWATPQIEKILLPAAHFDGICSDVREVNVNREDCASLPASAVLLDTNGDHANREATSVKGEQREESYFALDQAYDDLSSDPNSERQRRSTASRPRVSGTAEEGKPLSRAAGSEDNGYASRCSQQGIASKLPRTPTVEGTCFESRPKADTIEPQKIVNGGNRTTIVPSLTDVSCASSAGRSSRSTPRTTSPVHSSFLSSTNLATDVHAKVGTIHAHPAGRRNLELGVVLSNRAQEALPVDGLDVTVPSSRPSGRHASRQVSTTRQTNRVWAPLRLPAQRARAALRQTSRRALGTSVRSIVGDAQGPCLEECQLSSVCNEGAKRRPPERLRSSPRRKGGHGNIDETRRRRKCTASERTKSPPPRQAKCELPGHSRPEEVKTDVRRGTLISCTKHRRQGILVRNLHEGAEEVEGPMELDGNVTRRSKRRRSGAGDSCAGALQSS